ncbi:EndoU domain-containing protein [Clostridium felsineum]|uniref:EndoU domain-containing protein n=1 Tax=Clostridium felsineum TaxID=36839 RepID=UPI0009C5B471|nr:EndoU domain-containing protein [Clostridium felsineum]URZ04235.1 hypothetical protein CLAUR_043230 [Clostridium felsineum]
MEKIIGNAKRIQTCIGYFELGASISVANNLILGLPGLLGVYNDKRLIYKLENEKRYGVLAAYQYGRVAGDLEGEIQGTVELFSGLSIMGFGGLGAGALTVATDGAAAPAVPAVESVGVAVAAHGIGMTTSSFLHIGSDFAKGNFYFSKMKNGVGKAETVSIDALNHSSIGDFTYNPKTGKVSKMKGGGHGQANIDFLEKNGIEYNIEKEYSNGVRVGNVPDHKVKAKRSGMEQSWFPKTWSESDIQAAGESVANKAGNTGVADGVAVFGEYNGVRVGVIRTDGKIATVFPDSVMQPGN